jgi:L,D-peptidoglycan transpeptidase YkuD (ErfK/YbiS/YcfS/YnhG family)
MIKTIAVLALLALSAVAPAGGHSRVALCPPTLANQLTTTGIATQLVTVVAPFDSSSRGSVRLWKKSGDCWLAASGRWPAWLGRRGISEHHREGDQTTPSGIFGFGSVMYGVAPDPGVHYPYRRIVCGDWWVEDSKSRFYNQFRHERCNRRPPFKVTSEDLSRSPTAYRHFAFIRYNTDPIVPGRGSGIFLHASTGKPTVGCVSLAAPHLVEALRWLRPSSAPLIAIGTPATFSDLEYG